MERRPTDVGRTSGGGSLGHDQPRDVEDQTGVRNDANERPPERDEVSDRDEDDPVMPSNDSTLNTRI